MRGLDVAFIRTFVSVSGRASVTAAANALGLTLVFREPVLTGQREGGIAWRSVFEAGGLEAAATAMRADLAVGAWLASTLPPGLRRLPASCGLPGLPRFSVGLLMPRSPKGPVAALGALLRASAVGMASAGKRSG